MGDTDDGAEGSLKPGLLLGDKYRIERLIGRGGMAEVYAAVHELLHQPVAVKVLLPEIAKNAVASERFLQEARVAARIRGEHVTSVLDVAMTPDGVAYMVLEYLDGLDLEAFAEQNQPLRVDLVVDLVLQALDGLAQAHALEIVHRDIKPSNLFLSRRVDGSIVVKVLDFGISKSPSGTAGQATTASQVVLGSPLYMSPEQARSAKRVDLRTDIWAVGVMLYRLLTGELPFGGESLTELLLAIVEKTPTPVGDLRAEVPAGLAAIVMRCLEKDRERRFANVAELAMALEPFAGRDSTGAVDRIGRTLRISRVDVASAAKRAGASLVITGPESALPEDSTFQAPLQRFDAGVVSSTSPGIDTGDASVPVSLGPAPIVIAVTGDAPAPPVPHRFEATNASASWAASQAGAAAAPSAAPRKLWPIGAVGAVVMAGVATAALLSHRTSSTATLAPPPSTPPNAATAEPAPPPPQPTPTATTPAPIDSSITAAAVAPSTRPNASAIRSTSPATSAPRRVSPRAPAPPSPRATPPSPPTAPDDILGRRN